MFSREFATALFVEPTIVAAQLHLPTCGRDCSWASVATAPPENTNDQRPTLETASPLDAARLAQRCRDGGRACRLIWRAHLHALG